MFAESSKSRANGISGKASGASAEQLKFCQKLLNTLTSKQHASWMFYFYEPVGMYFETLSCWYRVVDNIP